MRCERAVKSCLIKKSDLKCGEKCAGIGANRIILMDMLSSVPIDAFCSLSKCFAKQHHLFQFGTLIAVIDLVYMINNN